MLQTHRVRTLDQVRSFLDGAEPVEVQPLDRSARYEFVARTLRRFGYWQPGKADKGMARRFAGAGAAAPAHGPGRGGPPAPVNDGVCHLRARRRRRCRRTRSASPIRGSGELRPHPPRSPAEHAPATASKRQVDDAIRAAESAAARPSRTYNEPPSEGGPPADLGDSAGRLTNAHRGAKGDQGPRIPRGPHAGQRERGGPAWPRGPRGARGGGGHRRRRRRLRRGGRGDRGGCEGGLRTRGDDRQGQGAPARRACDAARRSGPLHLPPSRSRFPPDRGPRRERGGLHRVRDGHLARRRPASPRADVGGGGPALDPGRRPCPRTGQRRKGYSPRRGAGRAAGQGGRHRRRRGRHPCRAHRDGDGRRYVGHRPLRRGPQGPVAPVRAPSRHRVLDEDRDRAPCLRRGRGDRRGCSFRARRLPSSSPRT